MPRFPAEALAPAVGRLLAGVSGVAMPTADAVADGQAGEADHQVDQDPDVRKFNQGSCLRRLELVGLSS